VAVTIDGQEDTNTGSLGCYWSRKVTKRFKKCRHTDGLTQFG
jgi:hypothetical protein